MGIGPIPEHPAHASQSDLDSYVSNGGPFGYLGHPVPLFGGELGAVSRLPKGGSLGGPGGSVAV